MLNALLTRQVRELAKSLLNDPKIKASGRLKDVEAICNLAIGVEEDHEKQTELLEGQREIMRRIGEIKNGVVPIQT